MPQKETHAAISGCQLPSRRLRPVRRNRSSDRRDPRAQPGNDCWLPMGHTPRPRSTSAVSGYWKPPIWTRRSRGRARVPSPAMPRAKCASSFSTRLQNQNPAKASKQPAHCGTGTRASGNLGNVPQVSSVRLCRRLGRIQRPVPGIRRPSPWRGRSRAPFSRATARGIEAKIVRLGCRF